MPGKHNLAWSGGQELRLIHAQSFEILFDDYSTKPAIARQPAEVRQPHPWAGLADCEENYSLYT